MNNAGVESDNLPARGHAAESWQRLFATNVFGLVEVTKRAVPLIRAAGGGVICNITSSSTLAPVPFLGTYRASKAAVTAIGESLAAEVAQFGIRVHRGHARPDRDRHARASDRPPVAAEHAEYRRLAERIWEGRQGIRDAYTPADEAARRIVDAICDDDGPLRYGCDDSARACSRAGTPPTTRNGCAGCCVRSRDHRARAHRVARRRRRRRGRVVPRRARPRRCCRRRTAWTATRSRATWVSSLPVAGRREGGDRRRRRRQRSRDRGHRVPIGDDRRAAGGRGDPPRLHARRLALRRRRRDARRARERRASTFLVESVADVAGRAHHVVRRPVGERLHPGGEGAQARTRRTTASSSTRAGTRLDLVADLDVVRAVGRELGLERAAHRCTASRWHSIHSQPARW